MVKAANIPQKPAPWPCIDEECSKFALMTGYQNRWHRSCVKSSMLQRLTLITFLALPFVALGQFGVNLRFLTTEPVLSAPQDGIHAGVEYHFRLKSNRVEFHPELGYRRSFTNANFPGITSAIDFDFNTSIYPFDFEGDCNCPTFSKQGTLIKKGFFFEIQPGVSQQTVSIPPLEEEDIQHLIFKFGVAAGLDVGISDHFTVTPYIAGTRFFTGPFEEELGEGANHIVFSPGIRFSYSVDEKKRRRRN